MAAKVRRWLTLSRTGAFATPAKRRRCGHGWHRRSLGDTIVVASRPSWAHWPPLFLRLPSRLRSRRSAKLFADQAWPATFGPVARQTRMASRRSAYPPLIRQDGAGSGTEEPQLRIRNMGTMSTGRSGWLINTPALAALHFASINCQRRTGTPPRLGGL